jgi:predicted KAP-like P-loop ATPase
VLELKLNEHEPIFLSDALPEDLTQDILNRRRFVEILATRILEFKDPNCLIIGIHGPWGSGKSTFLKFLESEMANRSADVVIVHFNPWNFSSIDQLVTMFFRELKLVISSDINLRELTSEIGERLEILGKILSPIEVVKSFVLILPGLEKLPNAIEKAGSGIKQLAEQDPSDLKIELNKLLAKYKKRIVILIDDIDRLDKESMRLLFRLIRLNADFINTTYILSFDRKVVEEALKGEQGISGREYIEKFIQVPFDLPLPDHKIIIEYLSEKIAKIFPPSANKDFESYRGEKLRNKIYEFFRTLRDIKRYSNSLLLTLPSINEEINYLDFAALEAIRLFCPDVYNQMPNNKDLLLGNKPLFSLDLNQAEIEQRKIKIDNIAKLADQKYQKTVRNIISELFPHAGEAAYNGHNRYYRIDKRICSSDRFDRYFLLAVPEGEISQVEIDHALKIINDRDLFIRLLKEYNEYGILMQFLKRIEDYTDNMSCENINNIIYTFLEIGDELSRMDNGRINRDMKIRMGFVIIDLLEKINGPTKRAEILRGCIENTKGFYILLYVVFQINKDLEKKNLFPEQEFQIIKNLTAAKIREEASKDDFVKKPHLCSILFRWKEFGDLNEPREMVSKLVTDDFRVIRLLVEFLTESYNDYNGPQYSMEDRNLEELSEFANLSEIYSKLKLIEQEKPYLITGELEKIAVGDFIKLFERNDIK